jgi:uncharacterized membrane protein YhaH (DUF805 family)
VAKAWSEISGKFVRLTMRQVMFSFRGRIGRATYIRGIALNLIVGLITIGAGIWLCQAHDTFGVGIILLVIGGIGMFWCGIALQVKRLHDLGFQGANVLWILLLGLACRPVSLASNLAGLLLCLASLAIGLCLLAWSGSDKPNRYGPPLIQSTPAT